MYLEARSPSCFSDRYVLEWDRLPHGEFRGRWFTETIDIRLTGRRQMTFVSRGWMSNSFELRDATTGEALAGAQRNGWFDRGWTLLLRIGSATLTSAGIFNTGYVLTAAGERRATVDRIGLCEGGWAVRGYEQLPEIDMIFVGLIYHTILRHRRSTRSAGA